MSKSQNADFPTRKERLRPLYEVHEELQLIADSDAAYAKYAQEFLDSLREVGYDV